MRGRPESPLDPNEGPIQRLAFEMRKLREEAGRPSYREMARRTGLGASTLSQAAAGERLVTLAVVLAYVQACGGDTEEWERRWRRASEEEAVRRMPEEDAAPPYRGLQRFEPGDQGLFFGREEITARLAAHVRAHRLVAVVGASGSGKSSLLRAGLIPALQAPDGPDLRAAALRILTPGPYPLSAHAAKLEPVQAEGDTVVVIDQFEELFTLCTNPAEQTAFLNQVVAAVKPGSRLRVVMAVRADFFARCTEHHRLAEALRDTTLVVGPMGPAELREAIIRPAAATGLVVERGLTARIVQEVAEEPGGLPLMSHTLLETWRRRRGRALTEEMYEAAGGLHGSIARTAEDLYTRLSPLQADTARRILLRLVAPGDGTPDTRRPTHRNELDATGTGVPGTANVLDQLVKARLITLDGETVDLAHEALITAWPRYHAWIGHARERLRTHRQLTEAAHTWHSLDLDPGALYRGTRLATAEDTFTPEHHTDLNALEHAFLTASTTARDHATRVAARTTRRLRSLTITLSALLALAITTSLIAWNQTHTSEQARHKAIAAQQVALSRQLATQSTALIRTEPDTASLLAIQAYRSSPTTEATDSLYVAASLPLKRRLAKGLGPVSSLTFSQDGRQLATGSFDGTVLVWATAEGRPPTILSSRSSDRPTLLKQYSAAPLAFGMNGAASLMFDANGHHLVVSRWSGEVESWNLATRRFRTVSTGISGAAASVLSPDRRTVATYDNDGKVRLWDVEHSGLRNSLAVTGHIRAMAFSADGRSLAVGGDTGVRLWDVATGHSRGKLVGDDGAVASLAFSRDGRKIAAGDSRTVRLWDAASGHAEAAFTGHTGTITSLAFSPDGRTLATGSNDSTVRLWNAANGRTNATFIGHADAITSLAFSPDGRTLATGSNDSTVRLWDAAAGTARVVLSHADGQSGIAFSPHGHLLAAAGSDGTVQLWNTSTGKAVTTLASYFRDNGIKVSSLAFSPDGRTLAVSSRGTTTLWDAAAGTARVVLSHADGQSGIAFSPHGHLLAAAGSDGTVQLWNTSTGKAVTTLASYFRDNGIKVSSLAFSPDGRTLAVSSRGGEVDLWDIAASRMDIVMGVAMASTSPVTNTRHPVSVAFSPNGNIIATSGTNGSAQLRDATGHIRVTLNASTAPVTWITFSPDGRTIATSTANGKIQLWDVTTGHLRITLDASAALVTWVGFSPDGHTIAISTIDAEIQLWNALPSPAAAAEKICRTLRRDFTPQERSLYLAGQSQQPVCSTAH